MHKERLEEFEARLEEKLLLFADGNFDLSTVEPVWELPEPGSPTQRLQIMPGEKVRVYRELAYSTDPRIYDHLVKLATGRGDGSERVRSLRRAAIHFLGESEDRRAIPVLQHLLTTHSTEEFRAAIRNALVRLTIDWSRTNLANVHRYSVDGNVRDLDARIVCSQCGSTDVGKWLGNWPPGCPPRESRYKGRYTQFWYYLFNRAYRLWDAGRAEDALAILDGITLGEGHYQYPPRYWECNSCKHKWERRYSKIALMHWRGVVMEKDLRYQRALRMNRLLDEVHPPR